MPRFPLIACAVLTSALLASPAHAGLLAPDGVVGGKSQNDYAEDWWNWAASYPADSNPVLDSTGEFAYLGDQGQVFFLAGHFGGLGPVTRTATVRRNQYLFLPLVNGVTTELDSAYGPSYEEMKQDVIEFSGEGSDFYLELDGTNLAGGADLNGWLQLSPDIFVLNFPPGGIFTDDDYKGPINSVQRGWWVMLAPLPVGTYTLRFGGKATPSGIYAGLDPNVQDVTYHLTVVPEPSSLALGLIAASGVGMLAVSRKRARKA